MNLSQKVKPYKKVDGIHTEEKTTWQKFLSEIGRFFSEAAIGKFEIKWTWKF